MNKWQPIETAPKDDILLGYYPDSQETAACPLYQVCCWDLDKWIGDTGVSEDFQPTHWMPLPGSPKGEQNE